MALSLRGFQQAGFDERPVLRVAVLWYLAAASAYSAYRYLLEIAHGGHVWTTGDWLISYRAGFVRRGLTGSLTYGISDLTGVNSLYIAAATQLLVFAAMVAAVLFILSRVKMTVPVALLALSPVFLLMPFYILKLAMTKEMIGYLAIALVGTAAFTERRGAFVAGLAVFAAAGFAHEINAFLAPVLLSVLFVLERRRLISRRWAIFSAVSVVVSAGAAIVTSFLFNGNGMGAAICQVILSYGGRAYYCGPEGPTFWLDRDMAYGMHFTWDVNVASGVWPWFVLGFGLSMAPFLLFRVTGDGSGRLTRLVFLAACLGILTFSPLFVIASDWGRWISMHIFGLTILAFVSLRLGLIEERIHNLNPVFLIFAFVWAMPDFGAPLTAGILQKVITLESRAEQFLGG